MSATNTELASTNVISLLHRDPIYNELLLEMEKFVAMLREYGISVKIDSPEAHLAWSQIPDMAKTKILAGFAGYSNNCAELHRSGVNLRDNFSLLTHSLKRSNLFSNEDIRSFLTDDNIAEVYNLNHVQIFRTINFFDYCNYSVLDLLAREWFVLYERLSTVTEYAMREFLQSIASGKLQRLTVPRHILKERDSNPRGVFQFDFQYCCPLFSAPGVVGGYLLTENVRELDLFTAENDSFTFLR